LEFEEAELEYRRRHLRGIYSIKINDGENPDQDNNNEEYHGTGGNDWVPPRELAQYVPPDTGNTATYKGRGSDARNYQDQIPNRSGPGLEPSHGYNTHVLYDWHYRTKENNFGETRWIEDTHDNSKPHPPVPSSPGARSTGNSATNSPQVARPKRFSDM